MSELTEKGVLVLPEQLAKGRHAQEGKSADEGWKEPPIMGEVVAPAINGAVMAAMEAGLMSRVAGDLVIAGRAALVLAAAESCERRSFVPEVLFNRWHAAALDDGHETLAQGLAAEKEALEPFMELLVALMNGLWFRVERRRMFAEKRAERAAAAAPKVRFEDVEPELMRILGGRYRPPTTPQRRERLIGFWQRWKKATTEKQRAAALKWLEKAG